MIHVSQTDDGDPLRFEVLVREEDGQSRHQVTLDRQMARRLAGDHPPEACIEAAFRFLLDRESRQSILARFDISVISQYFPEFEATVPEYLGRE